MQENKSVGPNLKTYYYYTNKMADNSDAKGVIVIATGMEGTGKLYDEVGEYLDKAGYAMYAIDELGYGKTGKVVKSIYKNWNKKDFHFAAYNVHALSVLAKRAHPNCPIYLIGNDFGAMLSLYLIKEFPEVIDKVVTIGWGAPRGQDYGFLITSWLKKVFLYDSGTSKLSHKSKNKRFAFRFENTSKYAWLSRDEEQVRKIVEAGFIDTAGTIGHYYYYFKNKIATPMFMKMKKCDKNTPMLFVSGSEDLLTKKGRTTEKLMKLYKRRDFTNVDYLMLSGRHQLLFEENRFENIKAILNWLDSEKATYVESINAVEEEPVTEVISSPVQEVEEELNIDIIENEYKSNKKEIEKIQNNIYDFQEAEDDLLIKTDKN